MFCAKDIDKVFCNGDSDGPAMIRNKMNQWTVVGVVSGSEGCAKEKYPGFYPRVNQYVDWIEKNMKIMS